MKIKNEVKAKISYKHRFEIQRIFGNHIRGVLGIDHFSLNIFFGNGQSIFLSPTPEMAEELCRYDFVNEDSNYNPDIYSKFEFYPWYSVKQHDTDVAINFIKEKKFNMQSGVMLVRDLGCDRYVMYSIATHKKGMPKSNHNFHLLYYSKADYLARMGDFFYNNLNDIVNEYSQPMGIEMPKIDKQKPVNFNCDLYSDEQRFLLDSLNGNGGSLDASILAKRIRETRFILANDGKIERKK